jgi:hypothetical protein
MIGVACGRNGKNEKFIKYLETLKGRDHLEDPDTWEDIGVDVREKGWKSVEWFRLAQVRDQWRLLMKTAMSVRIPYNSGNFLTS